MPRDPSEPTPEDIKKLKEGIGALNSGNVEGAAKAWREAQEAQKKPKT